MDARASPRKITGSMSEDEKKKVPPIAQRREAFARKQAEAGKGVLPAYLEGAQPTGTGPTNRHGMPQLPPGQFPPGMDPDNLPDLTKLKFPKQP